MIDNPNEPDLPRNAIYINGKLVHSNTPQEPPKAPKVWCAPELDPSILPGPKLKIKRAKQHIAELEAVLIAFNERRPYELIHEIDPKTGENVYRVLIKEVLPCELPTILGDIVHNLRAALDQTVCDLIRANRKQPKRGSGFPISGTRERLKSNAIGKINGVSAKARRFIERLKPYKGGNTPLWVLHELDALDKHSGIIPVAAAHVAIAARWALPMMFWGPDGSLRIGGPGPDGTPMWTGFGVPDGSRLVFPLKDQSEIYRSAPSGVNENMEAEIAVAFGESEIIQGEPVLETLHQIAIFVERTIAIVEKRIL